VLNTFVVIFQLSSALSTLLFLIIFWFQ